MAYILNYIKILFLFVASPALASDFYRDVEVSSYNVEVINIYNDTTLSGTQDFSGKVLNIYAKISGTCKIKDAIIIASPFIQIFDTTVTFGLNVFIREFSGMWFGADPANADNSVQLQKCIDACINKFDLYIPAGKYKISQGLSIISSDVNGYLQSQLHLYGESSFWGDGGTTISYSGDGTALAMQLNKGSEIDHLIIDGKWISPSGTDSEYYNISEANYVNQGTAGNGKGIWIDPFFQNNSGSTGCKFHDIIVKNFKTLIKIGNTQGTQNGEIMIFDDIQLGAAKVGIETSQAQEKANRFTGIYSWGRIFYIFTNANNQQGNYYIDGLNVAGKCINLFKIVASGWFPTYISRVFAEGIYSIGTIYAAAPVGFQNSTIDFVVPSIAGQRPLLTSFTFSNALKFDNCQFRFFGTNDSMRFNQGTATFDNCSFSGTVVNPPAASQGSNLFITYDSGGVKYGSSKAIIQQIFDTAKVSQNLLRIKVKTQQ